MVWSYFPLEAIQAIGYCSTDKTTTGATAIFEVLLFTLSPLVLYALHKIRKNVLRDLALIAIGIFIFEFFTAPLWHNSHLGMYAYVYKDVSWVLTLGWSMLIVTITSLVDFWFPKKSERWRFITSIVGLGIVGYFAEILVVALGIRTYSPEALETAAGYFWLGAPLGSLYYIPAFMCLVIGFYRYWANYLDKKPQVPIKRGHTVRNFFIVAISVFLFEIMVEPLVVNAKLPSWSYIYRDVSILMTLGWIVIIWLVMHLVDKFAIHKSFPVKFIYYLIGILLISTPYEAWLINNGYRIYGPSTQANFIGITAPLFNVPIEIVFAIPLYMGLIIGLSQFWIISLNNKR